MPSSDIHLLEERLAAIGSADLYGSAFANAVWSWAQQVVRELESLKAEVEILHRTLNARTEHLV